MKSKDRFVFDTNVLVSGVLTAIPRRFHSGRNFHPRLQKPRTESHTDVTIRIWWDEFQCIPLHWRYEPVLPELCQVQGKTGKDRIGADRYRIIDCFWSLPRTIDVNPFFRWIDEPAKL